MPPSNLELLLQDRLGVSAPGSPSNIQRKGSGGSSSTRGKGKTASRSSSPAASNVGVKYKDVMPQSNGKSKEAGTAGSRWAQQAKTQHHSPSPPSRRSASHAPPSQSRKAKSTHKSSKRSQPKPPPQSAPLESSFHSLRLDSSLPVAEPRPPPSISIISSSSIPTTQDISESALGTSRKRMDWSAEDDEEQDSFSLAEWGVELNESANTSGDGVDEIEGKDAPQSESTIPPPTSNLDQLQSPPQQIRATDINTALDTQGPFTSARDAAVSIQPSTSDSPPLPPQSAVTQPTATQETPSKSATSSSTSLHTPNGTPTRKRSPLSKEEQGARMSRLFGGALRGVANARSSESVRVNGVVSGQREGGPPVTNELRQEDPDQEEVATAAALVESSSERPNESEQPTEMPVPVDHSPLPTISATRPQRGRGRGRGGHHKKQTNSQQSKPEDGKLSNPASESTSALMDQQQHAEKPTVKLPVGSAASRWAS